MSSGLAQIAVMGLREIVDGSSTCVLPPLAELGRRLDVSIKVVSEAVKILKDEGVLSGKRGMRYKIIKAPDLANKEPYKNAVQTAGEELMKFVSDAVEKNQIRLPTLTACAKALGRNISTTREAFAILRGKGYVDKAGVWWIVNRESEQVKALAASIRESKPPDKGQDKTP
jgi:DNA-binding transcriptional regulator YhcF (GntR family)